MNELFSASHVLNPLTLINVTVSELQFIYFFFVVKTRLARIKKNTSIVSEMKAALQDMLPKLVAYGRKCNRRSVKAIVAQIDLEDEARKEGQ